MVRCRLPFIQVQSLVAQCVVRASLQQPNHIRQPCPQVTNAHRGCAFGLGWVQPAILPHPYKPLGICAGAPPHRHVTSCPSPMSWDQVATFHLSRWD